MRIESLEIENVRGFEKASLSFAPGVNLLVGANGSGKSTVLDAILFALSPLPAQALEVDPRAVHSPVSLKHEQYLPREENAWGCGRNDIRTSAAQLSVMAVIRYGQTKVVAQHRCSIDGEKVAESWTVESVVENLRQAGLLQRKPWPVLVVADAERTHAARTSHELDSFYDSAAPRAAQLLRAMWSGAHCSFIAFASWFRLQEDLENQERVERRDLDWSSRSLSAVRRAVEGVLPGFSRLRVQRSPLHLVVDKGGRPFFLEQLSDGERTLVAMVADLAYRLSVVHDELEDPLQGEAVMLIDEVELHLHPRLQRVLLPRLHRAFPNVQFIATTHSPQVLASVPAERVQVLDQFRVYGSATTEGRDSNAILLEVFGVQARPDAQQQQLVAIEEAIDRGEFSDARALLDAFEQVVTDRDHDVIRLRSMLSVLDAAQ